MDGRMDGGFVLRDVSSLSFGETERQRNFKQKHLDADETSAGAAQFTKRLAETVEMLKFFKKHKTHVCLFLVWSE